MPKKCLCDSGFNWVAMCLGGHSAKCGEIFGCYKKHAGVFDAGVVLPASTEERPEALLVTSQCAGQTPTRKDLSRPE